MDMTPYQLKLLTSNGWIEKYQPLTIDMTKDTYTGLYRVGLIFLFIPETRACRKIEKNVIRCIFGQFLFGLRHFDVSSVVWRTKNNPELPGCLV